MSTAHEVLIKLAADSSALVSGLNTAQGALSRFESGVAKVKGMLGGAAVLAAGFGLVSFAKSAIDAADALHDLAQKTGSSVEDLSAMRLVAEQNGTSLDSVARAFKTLSKNQFEASTGNKEAAALFSAFKISGDNALESLIKVSDLFAQMPDGMQKSALAQKLFGKAGEDMIPILNQGSAALREQIEWTKQHAGISTEAAARADAFNDKIAELKAGLLSFTITVTDPVLTFFRDMNREIGLAIKHFGSFGSGFVGTVTINPLKPIEENIKEVSAAIAALEKQTQSAGGREGLLMKGLDPHGTATRATQDRLAFLKNQLAYLKELQKLEQPAAPATPAKPKAMPPELQSLLAPAEKDPLEPYLAKTTKRLQAQYQKLRAAALKIKDQAQRDEVLQSLAEQLLGEPSAKEVAAAFAEQQKAIQKHIKETEDRVREDLKKFDDLGKQIGGSFRDSVADLGIEDVYARHHQAAGAVLEPLRESLEKLNSAVDPARFKEFTSHFETLSRLTHLAADVSAATEGMSDASIQRQFRIAELTAEVAAGIKTEAAARVESRSAAQEALEHYRKHMAVLGELAQQGYPAAIEAMARFKAEFIGLQDAAKDKTWLDGLQQGLQDVGGQSLDAFEKIRSVTVRAFQGMEDALVNFVTTGKLNFKSLASSIISDLVRIQVQQSIVQPLAQAFGSLNLFGSAKGNVMTPTGPLPGYAFGGVASGPTSGYPTLLHGTEAILPLKRGADGRLGVSGETGAPASGVVVNQTLNISTGVAQTVRAEIMNLLPQIAASAKNAVADANLRGGSFAAAMR